MKNNTMNTNNTITPFIFGEKLIRIVTRDGDPWFVGKDVCEHLGLGNASQAIKGNSASGALGLDDDEADIMNLIARFR